MEALSVYTGLSIEELEEKSYDELKAMLDDMNNEEAVEEVMTVEV